MACPLLSLLTGLAVGWFSVWFQIGGRADREDYLVAASGYGAGAVVVLLGLPGARAARRARLDLRHRSRRRSAVCAARPSLSGDGTGDGAGRPHHQPLVRRARRGARLPVDLAGRRARAARAARPRTESRAGHCARGTTGRTVTSGIVASRGRSRTCTIASATVSGRSRRRRRTSCPPARAPSPASASRSGPGRPMVTRTPCSGSSARSESASARSPCLEAAYADQLRVRRAGRRRS